MECKDCKYHYNDTADGNFINLNMCTITHRCLTQSCDYIQSDSEVESMNICYNCKHWIGGGDWGLSCAKNYYSCNTNGFVEACEQFERK